MRLDPALKALIAATALSALVAACDRNGDKAVDAQPVAGDPAAVTPADSPAPLVWEEKTPHAEVKLTLPAAVKAHADLHARLYADGVKELRGFAEGAQADRTEFGDGDQMPAYVKNLEWTLGGETGKLFSLKGQIYDYSGGAHPNAQFTSSLWDKALKRPVTAQTLFRKGANLAPLDQALCAAINTAKKARDASATPVSLGATNGQACPRAADTPFVLAGGTAAGKAGGLTFLIAPYLVGPYAEGSYEVAVPQSAFSTLLAPAYADEFAGQPVAAKPAAVPAPGAKGG